MTKKPVPTRFSFFIPTVLTALQNFKEVPPGSPMIARVVFPTLEWVIASQHMSFGNPFHWKYPQAGTVFTLWFRALPHPTCLGDS